MKKNIFDEQVFGNKQYNHILEKIYNNQEARKIQLTELIDELMELIKKNIEDATILVPLMQEYMNLDLKNEDVLIKLANIVSKGIEIDKKSFSGNKEKEIESEVEVLTELDKKNILKDVEIKRQQHLKSLGVN